MSGVAHEEGSPPYTWGAHSGIRTRPALIGITPIYMGSTLTMCPGRMDSRDHPHIHGEHQISRFNPKVDVGITPIYMGSTADTNAATVVPKDHPHIHGEHPTLAGWWFAHRGSPPYTWGAPAQMRAAGQKVTDHPHIHGEHLPREREIQTVQGSPPYTWGAPDSDGQRGRFFGITPIYMGSTPWWNSARVA